MGSPRTILSSCFEDPLQSLNPLPGRKVILMRTPPTFFGIYSLYNAFGGSALTDPTQAGLDFFEHSSDSDAKRLVETDSVSLTVNWDLNDDYRLTSITSWDDGAAFNPDNTDSVIHEASLVRYRADTEQVTQDLRLTSTFDGPFNFVAGLYYSDEEVESVNKVGTFFDIDFNLDGMVNTSDCWDPLAIAFGLPPSEAGAATEAVFNSLGFSLGGFASLGCFASNSFTQEKTSYAAYFDGSYDITESLTLRFGLRFTDDEAELNDFNAHFASADGTPLIGTINGGSLDPLATAPDQEFSDSEWTGENWPGLYL